MQLPVLGKPTLITFTTKSGVELVFRKPTTEALSTLFSTSSPKGNKMLLSYASSMLYGYEKDNGEEYTPEELLEFMSNVEFEDIDEFNKMLDALGMTENVKKKE